MMILKHSPRRLRALCVALLGVAASASLLASVPTPPMGGAPIGALTSGPQVSSVVAPTDSIYMGGNALSFTVNFNAAVDVTGVPRLVLTIGSSTVYADYASGTGTAALTFSYTVQPGDVDLDGIAVSSPIDLNGGTIKAVSNSLDAILTFTAPTTTAVLVDALPAEVLAHDSGELALYLASSQVSTIYLLPATTYAYDGGEIARTLTIHGNGATLQAGAGVTDDVIRSGTAGGVTFSLPDYLGVKVFLKVTGSLSLDHLTIQNNGANAATAGFFTVINVKNGGTLSADFLALEDFHNNPTPGTNLAFGIHTEPLAAGLTLTNSTIASSNAFRNAVAARGGVLTITDNFFYGTVYPERLRNSDGYEYALYVYGGSGTIERNTVDSYDSTTQPGYSSAALAIIGFYNINLTVAGNLLSNNSIGIDVTRMWTNYSTPLPTVTINGITLDSADAAFAIGEGLRIANLEENVSVSFDQNDEVELTPVSGPAYFGVLGGYRSPYLTVTSVTPTSATIDLPASERDVLAAANSIELEMLMDGSITWVPATPVWSGTPSSSAALTLQRDHAYLFRVKLTHTSAVDGGDPTPRTLVTYSAPVPIDTHFPSAITSVTAPSDGSYTLGDTLSFTVNFDAPVTVTGTPQLELTIGTSTVYATYASGSGGTSLIFSYTLPSGGIDVDGIAVASPVALNGGAILTSSNTLPAFLMFMPPATTGVLVDALPSEVTAHDSSELALYLGSPRVSIIHLVPATTYTYDGGTIARPVTIHGHGATLQAGAGVTDDVIRSGTAGGVTFSLSDYLGVKVFLKVTGSLSLDNLTIQNNGANAATAGFFTVINVKNGGALSADHVTLQDFHNNPTPGTNLCFGIHAEPLAASLTLTNSTIASSNAFRNAIAARGGALTITGNAFAGTIHPERLRNSDGYEYAIFLYGGSGTVANNTIDGYDSTTQPGYASAAVAIIGFYSVNLTVTGNVLSNNSIGIDVTRTWTNYSTPVPTVTVNGTTLDSSDAAYAMGEGLRSANNEQIVSVSLDQNDEVELTPVSGSPYTGVLGGYRSPYLTAGSITATSATITLPPGERDTLAAANAIELQMQADGSSTWAPAAPVWSGTPYHTATVSVQKFHVYRYRLKMTHTSAVDYNDPIARTLVTYSAPLTIDTNLGPIITSIGLPADGHYKKGDVLTFTANFDTSVTVTGAPQLPIIVGATTRLADFMSTGSTATALKFTYMVQNGDNDSDGIALSSPLSVAGGRIKATSNSADAVPSFVPPDSSGIVLDTTGPLVSSIMRQAPLTVNSGAGLVTWRVTFTDDVTRVDPADFGVVIVSGEPSGTVTAITPVSASTYDVTVAPTGRGGLRLDLKTFGADIVDLAGNPITGWFTLGEFYLTGTSNVFDTVSLASATPRVVAHDSNQQVAQRFTTSPLGSQTLATLAAAVGVVTGEPHPVVTLRADNGGAPGATVLATLTNPATLAANALNVWTSDVALSPSTTYWVVFADNSTGGAYNLETTAATSGGVGDWLASPADYAHRHGIGAATGPVAGAVKLAIGTTGAPAITSALTAGGTYGAVFARYAITASNAPESFAAAGLPLGLELDPATGAITGTPRESGVFHVALTATNDFGTSTPATLVLTIARAPLTVTAKNATRAYGAANPALGVDYSGFVLGDTSAVLTAAPGVSTTATPASNVGTYPITASGAAAANYAIAYVGGTLTVTPAPQTIDFAMIGDVFLGESATLVATASSGLTVSFEIASGPATLSGNTATSTGGGVVKVRAKQDGNTNYAAATPVERIFNVIVRSPVVTTPTQVPVPPVGGTVTLTVDVPDPSLTYDWQRNGTDLVVGPGTSLVLTDVQPPQAGLYTYTATLPGGGSGSSEPVIVGLSTDDKVVGTGMEVAGNIVHPNGNTYDQVLLSGNGAALTADRSQVTRISFTDLSNDIVQVEFSGPGTLSLVMDDAGTPAPAANYNQPGVDYVRGHAGIVITGADETSFVSVFTVGRATAVNQSLFRDGVNYDGVADIAFIAIQSKNGKFGAVLTGNTHYFAHSGFTGIYAPGVEITGAINVGDITAYDSAQPVFVIGSADGATRITGGSLLQANSQPIQVSGLTRLLFVDGTTSAGTRLPAQSNKGVLLENGVNVTDLIVVNPTP